jgi:type II secretory pathway pseudopilin PulG
MLGSSVRPRHQARQHGAVLLAVLVFVLITTMGASSLVEMYQTQSRREKEEHLLFVGDQYRRAIVSYSGVVPPGGARSLPKNIDDLTNDQRFATPIQHLRRAYLDPMTGKLDWEFVQGPYGILGVRSRSTQAPIKQKGFPKGYEHFEDRSSYGEWVFAVQQVH